MGQKDPSMLEYCSPSILMYKLLRQASIIYQLITHNTFFYHTFLFKNRNIRKGVQRLGCMSNV